ncbi:MAG: hypothetical protein JRH06_15810 [Deltaproteobacteria bacterium]|nr:hypothetical protein [Deltaproteobacteria bacterium]
MQNEEKIFMFLVLMIILAMVILSFGFRGGSKILPMISGISSAFVLGFVLVRFIVSYFLGKHSFTMTRQGDKTICNAPRKKTRI